MDCCAGLKSIVLPIVVAMLFPSGRCAADIELHVDRTGTMPGRAGMPDRPTWMGG